MPLVGRRMGRPGLIGAAARTAVVAGTATAVSGRVARRQQSKYAEQEAVPRGVVVERVTRLVSEAMVETDG